MLDSENALAAWMRANLSPAKVVTETPATLAGDTYRVARIGGRDDQVVIDRARFDIEFFGADRNAARKGCEVARSAFLVDLYGQTLTDDDGVTGFVVGIETEAAPRVMPYVNPNVRRAVMTVRIHIKTTP